MTYTMKDKVAELLEKHSNVLDNPERKVLIQDAVDNKEAIISSTGALVTWTPRESTGRSPKDTVIVKDGKSEKNIEANIKK